MCGTCGTHMGMIENVCNIYSDVKGKDYLGDQGIHGE